MSSQPTPPTTPGPSPAGGSAAGAPGSSAVRVTVKPNGPYLVQGLVSVCDVAGTVIREGQMIALCRCGQSATKPFCDGTHNRVSWRA